MQVFKIGEEFNLFKEKIIGIDCGAVLEALPGGGFALMILLDNMSSKEKQVLNKEKITVNIIKETESFILPLIHFRSSDLCFELDYDPTAYKDQRQEDMNKSNMITMFGLESTNNTIQALRYFSMPMTLYRLFLGCWYNAKQQQDFSEKYRRWVNDLQSRYSVLQLWDMGVYIGKMGE